MSQIKENLKALKLDDSDSDSISDKHQTVEGTNHSSKSIDIIDKDIKDEGEVPIKTWFSFFNYGLSYFGVALIIFFAACSISSNIIISFVIGAWTEGVAVEQDDPVYFHIFWL